MACSFVLLRDVAEPNDFRRAMILFGATGPKEP